MSFFLRAARVSEEPCRSRKIFAKCPNNRAATRKDSWKTNEERPLSGIKVVELATFVAAPSATRFFADQGVEVIRVEPLGGDNLRWCASTDGIPDDPFENVTFDLENANKKYISLNLKNPKCYEALFKLIGESDIFITNWRAQALTKLKLDYPSLSKRFPKLVYGVVTGYDDVGPDKDLPGHDATAFFTRSGVLGSVYEKGTVPMTSSPAWATARLVCALLPVSSQRSTRQERPAGTRGLQSA